MISLINFFNLLLFLVFSVDSSYGLKCYVCGDGLCNDSGFFGYLKPIEDLKECPPNFSRCGVRCQLIKTVFFYFKNWY